MSKSSEDYVSVIRKGLKLKGNASNPSAIARSGAATTTSSRKKRELSEVQPPSATQPTSTAPPAAPPAAAAAAVGDPSRAKRGKLDEPSSPPPEVSAAAVALEAYERKLTAAERAFQLVQRKRERERAAKRVELTHRQKMERLNSHLATLSEHFDIPKVGPG